MNRTEILELEQRIGTNDALNYLEMEGPDNFEGDFEAMRKELSDRLAPASSDTTNVSEEN